MVKISKLYKLRNRINGKEYIGVSHDPVGCFNDHCKNSRNTIISRAIKKHGRENFELTTLLIGPEEYCFEMEGSLIDAFNSRKPNGYNVAIGGKGTRKGTKFDEVARANMKAAAKARGPRGPMSEETKAKIAAKQKGVPRRKHTQAEKDAVRAKLQNRIVSEETKMKMKNSGKARYIREIEQGVSTFNQQGPNWPKHKKPG